MFFGDTGGPLSGYSNPRSLSPSTASLHHSAPPEQSRLTSETGAIIENRPGCVVSSSTSAPVSSHPESTAKHSKGRKRKTSALEKISSLFIDIKPPVAESGEAKDNRMSSGHSTSEQVKLRHPSQRSSMQPANIHENAAGRSKPGKFSTFQVGVSEDRNLAWRSTMEDTHSYVYDFQGVHFVNTARDSSIKASSPVIEKVYAETDNGYAAIFDGHAGAVSAEWCGKNIHVILQRLMEENPGTSPPVLLDRAFTEADETMKDLGMYSGCTAVVAVLRWEDRISLSSSVDASSKTTPSPKIDADNPSKSKESEFKPISGNDAPKSRQRVLYTANVGDARAVLCRDGKALRLSYDHKASDANERKRIDDAGGLVVGSRVNGVLAVTRALGDSYLKPFVTGHPFTTETQIQPDTDEFLILACDGVSTYSSLPPTILSCNAHMQLDWCLLSVLTSCLLFFFCLASSGMFVRTTTPSLLFETLPTHKKRRAS